MGRGREKAEWGSVGLGGGGVGWCMVMGRVG